MDIFDGNRKLEEAVMYAIDWGVFLRHDLDGPIAPFMYLFNGEEMQVRVLMTGDNPIDYAMKVLAKEEKPYQQFVIGMEGYLKDNQDQKIDSIIVQGFDKTQEKGVILGQMFKPKEKKGTFEKIARVTYLGSPELPIDLETVDHPDYSIQEPGFNAMALKSGDLTQYMAFITHDNPSVVANTMRRFLQSKLADSDSADLSGKFELVVTPGSITNDKFLKFLVLNAVEEERSSVHAIEWQNNTGRDILFNIKYGDEVYLTEFQEGDKTSKSIEATPTDPSDTKYATLTDQELRAEFDRITSIPNARTNISALTDMTDLMAEYEYRGMQLPDSKSPSLGMHRHTHNPRQQRPTGQKKPWWKFW